jgi:hypothetical protein
MRAGDRSWGTLLFSLFHFLDKFDRYVGYSGDLFDGKSLFGQESSNHLCFCHCEAFCEALCAASPEALFQGFTGSDLGDCFYDTHSILFS